ncbi:MAG: DUF11 domain-containing protein [Chloroflexi bacterium]|nr:DUF11 domain-containing protein [Chloroflexota bacterium]
MNVPLRAPDCRLVPRGWVLFLILLSGLLLFPIPVRADPDPNPPYWNGGTGPAVHFSPVAWPSDVAWTGYTKEGNLIKDQRTQDPSNGGTSPQNYVNVSSNCTDQALPSVFWTYDAPNQVLFFRWRVEQIANTYGTGPSAGAVSSSDPWKSAQWTVLIDIDGDGYREFAVHLDGSSGSPSKPVDRLVSIYSNTLSHSIDYLNDPDIHQLYHNPTAFVDQATNRILNFQNTLNPTTDWPNGSHETVWDYGTTRSRNISTGNCTEYLVDYQIPLAMLDARAVGGPAITANTPISMLFTTANSLQNPLQKDVVLNGDYIADVDEPGPFGDPLIPITGTIQQPIVESITASGCGPTTLTAQVRDTLSNLGQTNVSAVDFYYYYDRDGNGVADDGNAWTFAANGSTTNNPVGRWTATWNNASLVQGRYLIGVQATDLAAINADGKTHRTYSYLTAAQVTALGSPPPNELWFANPSPVPGVVTASATNTCGITPPSLSKSASPSIVTTGQLVTFTLTVNNTEATALTVSSITDTLPVGFTYIATSGASTLGAPVPTINGNLVTWNFSPAATVPAGSARTLIFTATAATTVGTYSNTATANTSIGLLQSNPAQVGVGLPRLTIAKAANVSSANPGNTITYTFTYANDSPVNVTGVTITDALPTGLTFVSAANGGSYNAGTRTIAWNVGAIASGDGPYTVSFSATVDNPYPIAAAIPLVNSATITSNETSPASASASTHVNAPRPALGIQKDANVTQVAPGGSATFTISYANSGNASATSVTITDAVPSGFTFVSATNGGTLSSGVVTWNIASVGAGASGLVQLTLQASNPFTRSNPAVNTAFLSSAQTAPVSDDFTIGITETGLVCRTYYFHNTTTNVGYDTPPDQRIGNTTAPLPSQTGTGILFTTIDGGGFSEVLRFYQDPPSRSTVSFASSIDSTIYIDRHPGSGIYLRGTVYDYDSASGIRTMIGSGTQEFGGNDTGQFNFSATPVVGAQLQPGHRLLWIYELASKNNNGGDRLLFQIDGWVVDSESGHGTSTFADSNSVFCVTAPANVVLDKQVSSLLAQAGSTLTYSIKFANAGTTNATNSLITDTLPSGTTFVSANLNGSPATPVAIAGQQYRFAVNSTGQASGVIAGGGSGVLTITVAVNQPLDPAISSLTNLVTLTTNETVPLNDSITTAVLRPNTTISKAASKTLLIPGDVVTYTLTVLNSGVITATNVTVNDPLPVTGYFTYVANSTTLNGTPVSPDPLSGNALNLNIGSLAPAAAASVTFRMVVSGVPFPGVTTHDNQATVSDAQTTGTRSSEVVTVSISTNPNLRVSKTIAPPGTLAPGDLVTYTLSLSNIGSGNAQNVNVEDFIPASTTYAPGTLYDQSVSQTDALDGDTGSFDATNNRVSFQFATLGGGATRTLQFSTRVNLPLPAGITPISNTVWASASNAATKQGSANTQASAAPVLTIGKTGPAVVAYPAARLTAAANGVTIQVDTTAQLNVQQYVNIAGQSRQIIAINGSTITLDAAVTASSGENVVGSITYTLRYANTGTAIATSVVMTDALPAGTSFVNATLGGAPSGGNVVWNLPDLAPGDSGLAQVTIFPTAIGSIVNTATLDSAQTTPVSANATTSVGGLLDSKYTTTPLVLQTLTGTEATYVLQVQNTSASPATGVVVTDTLSPGFTYSNTVSVSGFSARSPVTDPTIGSEQPVWGTFTIPGSTTLVITYTAKINPTVGAATYQNFFGSTSSSASVLVFDPLRTIAEDVQVEIPQVALSKTVSPSTVPVGQPVTYTIAALNSGDGAATGVVLTDTLPSGFTLLSTVSVTQDNASRTSTQNPTAGSATPAWGIWDIGAGGGVTVTFSAHTGSVTGVFSNTVSATASNTIINPVTNTAAVTTTASADLQVTKDATPNPVSVGMPLTYTLVTRNNGPSAATSVTLTDTLPSTVTVGTISSTQGSCGGSSTVVCNLGSMANGAIVTTTIVVTPTQAGSLINAVIVAASEFDPNVSNNSDTEITTANALADLAIGKTASPSPVNAGATLTYTLNVTNTGPSDAANVTVTDTLPAGVTYGSAGGAGWACGQSSGLVTCTRAAFAASATSAITVTVTAPSAGGTITNTATITSATTDPNLANNTASADTTVSSVADLAIAKNDGLSSVTPGTQITYTIVITNAGPSAANGAVVSDTLPAAITSAGWTCAASPGSSCARGSGSGSINTTVNLLAGGTATFTMTATVSASATGTLTNVATVAPPAGVTDPNSSNNTASDTDSLTPSADLAIGKTHAGNFTVGVNGTYTLTVTNLGPSTAAGTILVTDTLPSGLTFVSGTGTGWTCNAIGQTVSCSNPSNLAPSASSTITLVVGVAQGAAPGVTNSVVVSGPTADPNPGNNSATDPTTVAILPDLQLAKSHVGTPTPGGVLTYTLTYTNVGTVATNGVVITETVPQNARYTGSGWSCPSGSGAGTTCPRNIGSVGGGATGSVAFTVTISNPVPSGTTQIVNTASVADDGAQGPDPTPSNNTATDTASLTGLAPDLGIAITHTPASVTPGGIITFTLAYSNTGNIGATNVTITETVPANSTFTGAGWSCPTGSVAGTVCTRNVGSVAGGGGGASVEFVVTVVNPVPAGTTQIADNATIGDDGANGADANLANNSDSDAVPLVAQVDLRMSKNDGGVSVTPGGLITYTLAYTNAGNIAVTGVVITETIPANTTYAGTGWTCVGGTCTRSIGSVEGGATGSVAFTVQVANPVPPGTTQISNSAIIGDDHASGPDANPGDNSAMDTTPVLQDADLEIDKSDGQATAIPGASLTYTITVTNHGPIPVAGAGVSDTLPAALTNATWTCSASAGSSCASASGMGSINSTANLLVNGTATYLLTATVSSTATGSLANTATVAAPSGINDPIASNNSATDTDTLAPSADLAISKAHAGNFTVGVNASYTITVTNNGPSAVAAPILVTDTLPTGLTAISNSAGWSCLPNGQIISCSSATGLGVGASTTLILNVAVAQAAAPGGTNLAEVSNATSDPNPNNNTASDPTIVVETPDLALGKTHAGATTPNGTLTYTLVYTNSGDLTATGVVITETVPANTRYTGTGWTCPSGAGAGSTCTRSIGSVVGGATGSVTFTVTISNPLPAGTTQIANTATIADDGTHGSDATPSNNTATDLAPLTGLAPDLRVTKSDSSITPSPGGVLIYTINYTNTGNIGATNVVLTETVPPNTTFTGMGWNCAGSTCSRNVGALAGGGASGSAQFIVTVNNPIPPSVTQVTNTVVIGDDGANGADVNPNDNTATINTPILAVGAICVTVFNDLNGNGIRETGEGWLSGAQITVTNASSVAVAAWNSTPSQPYCFTNLPVGNYTVEERNPAGYRSTSPDLMSTEVEFGVAKLVDFGDQSSTSYLYLPLLVRAAQNTPTPTATSTSTRTQTPTSSVTPTSSITPTPSRTPTATQTRLMIDPKGMLSDPERDQLFLVSNGDSTVDVFRESTLATSPELLRKIGVGRGPFGIGMANGKVYIANFSGNSVSVIRAGDLVRLPDISLSSCGGEPTHLATNPGTGMVYVALHSGARVAVISAFTDALVSCVPVASGTFGGTFGLAVDTGTNSIFAGNRDGFDLWRIDGYTNNATRVRDYSNGNGGSPFYVGFNEVFRKLFVTVGFFEGTGANREIVPNKLYIYDVEWTGELSNETIVSVGNTDDGGFVVQSLCSAYIYVAETADNRLRALDPLDNYATVWTTTPSQYIDAHPYGLLESLSENYSRLYVSHKNPAHSLRIIEECPGPFNLSRSPRTIATPTRPRTVTATPTRTVTTLAGPAITTTPTRVPTGTATATRTRTATPTSTRTATSPPIATPTLSPTPSRTPTAMANK